MHEKLILSNPDILKMYIDINLKSVIHRQKENARYVVVNSTMLNNIS
jgi:hypothetical protein